MKNRITFINIIANLIQQIVTIISGFIIPKIILTYFGSDVNGLVSSINQFLNYITLLEGGVMGVISASLYKAIVKEDNEKISSIVNTSKTFFKKIGIIYIIYSIALAIIYPIFINNSFSFEYIFTLTIILSLSLLIQYMFSLSYKTFLMADKKIYIVSNTQTIITILNIILSYVSVKIYPSIHVLKLINGILFIIQPIAFGTYVKKNYKLNKKAKKDNQLIKDRWNGFAINLVAFIHFSTDVTIVTLFTDLQTVSVYSVYALVTSGLRAIINAISNAIIPTVGQAYAKNDEKELKTKFDLNEYIIFILVFYMFTIAALLITPFVMIYTRGINDANYNQPLFGVLLVISEALYLIKLPHLNLAYSANKFKEVTIPAFIEAFINIIVSAILVNKLGLIGVAIGTILGMAYRMMFHVKYTEKLIKGWKQINFYRKMLIFAITTIIGLCICYVIPLSEYNITSWIIHALIYMIIFEILYLVMSKIFFKQELKYIYKYFKKEK